MDVIFYGMDHVLMFLVMLLCVYPFYYVFIYSLSTPSDAQKGITFFPRGLTLSNYAQVFRLSGIPSEDINRDGYHDSVLFSVCVSGHKGKDVRKENHLSDGSNHHVF